MWLVCAHVCKPKYVHTCVYVHVCACVCVHVCACVCVHVHVCAHMCVCTWVCVCAHGCVCLIPVLSICSPPGKDICLPLYLQGLAHSTHICSLLEFLSWKAQIMQASLSHCLATNTLVPQAELSQRKLWKHPEEGLLSSLQGSGCKTPVQLA